MDPNIRQALNLANSVVRKEGGATGSAGPTGNGFQSGGAPLVSGDVHTDTYGGSEGSGKNPKRKVDTNANPNVQREKSTRGSSGGLG